MTLTAALAALCSSDPLARNDGVTTVIEIGSDAVPSLLALLEEHPSSRSQVMYALARIGDMRAEGVFAAALNDSDEHVRSSAAQGLVAIGHRDAMDALLRTLNDAPDILHLDRTPSVEALGSMGLRPVLSLLHLLMAQDSDTRMRAQRALEMIAARRHGSLPGKGFPSLQAEEAMRSEWRTNGEYQFDAPAVMREKAIVKWRQWLQTAKDSN